MVDSLKPSAFRLISNKFWRLVSNPIFPVLTICGNFLIIAGALTLYYIESGTNPAIHSFLDCVWWAVSTVTTVGYGDVVPKSPGGKIAGIVLMILGTALFWSYTALFADALISEEVSDLEKDIKAIVEQVVSGKK